MHLFTFPPRVRVRVHVHDRLIVTPHTGDSPRLAFPPKNHCRVPRACHSFTSGVLLAAHGPVPPRLVDLVTIAHTPCILGFRYHPHRIENDEIIFGNE